VLGAHLVKNHPLMDGNVQVALVATVEFCARNGFRWSPPPLDNDGEETAAVFLDLAAAPISESVIEKLSGWIAERIGLPHPKSATGAATL
jgi:prophage maintenance system killer protein